MNYPARMRLGLLQDGNISGEGLEANTVFLHPGEGDVAGLAGLDVGYGTRFSNVSAAHNLALSAILELAW